jgi:hypothetical protein
VPGVILLVAYDLHQPGRDYAEIEELLKSASGGYRHIQGSVWLLDTLKSPQQWVAWLKARGDTNDEYFVAQLKQNWWSYGMDADAMKWLKEPARRW